MSEEVDTFIVKNGPLTFASELPPPRYILQIRNEDDEMVVGITPVGTAEFGPGFKAPWRHRRASRQFWKQVAGLCGMSEPLP